MLTWVAGLLIAAGEAWLVTKGLNSVKPLAVWVGGLVGGLIGTGVLLGLFPGALAWEYALMGSVFGALAGASIVWFATGRSASEAGTVWHVSPH